MNIRLKERLASVVRQRELGHRLILLALVYVGVAAILLGFVLELRSEALAFTKRGLAAFLQLTEEQTTQTLQNAELTLDVVEARVAAEIQGGAVTAEQMSTLLRDLLLSRPALRAITLLDERGRIVYSSEPGRAGLDLSDREYFIHHRSRPGSGFLLSAPVRARTTAEWIIPVSRPMWGPYGDFAGVIVASLDPKFFSERWTNDKTIEAQTTTLWRNDGVVMMRSPFEEKNIGVVIKTGAIAEEVGPGRSNEGTLQAISVVDGKDRLIAYRRILAYPGFSLSVTQETARALAPWRKAAWRGLRRGGASASTLQRAPNRPPWQTGKRRTKSARRRRSPCSARWPSPTSSGRRPPAREPPRVFVLYRRRAVKRRGRWRARTGAVAPSPRPREVCGFVSCSFARCVRARSH